MLVIISDLHLTDGTSGTTVNPNAFAIFQERVRDLAYAASDRDRDGRRVYEPLSDVHVLLLGDILDVIRSTRWLRGEIRPWDDPASPALAARVRDITHAILVRNDESAKILRELRHLQLPAATNGQPDPHRKTTVNAHLHYLAGNHDWFYHLPGERFDAIRRDIVDMLGLDNDPREIFPHDTGDPHASPALRRVCEEHRVFARHGDVFDARNYEGSRHRSSLGDAIVIELLDRFTDSVESELGLRAPQGLREIDNVRPLELIPAWLDGLLRKNCDAATAREVRTIWNGVVRNFLKLDFVKRHRDVLKWGLELTENLTFHDLGRIVPWVASTARRWGLFRNYADFALKEKAFRDPRFSYIVYGHTHHHEIVPLRTATPGTQPEGIYLNSGTWRAVFNQAHAHPHGEDFFGYRVMTYLAFFKGDERHGNSFETWSGSLEYPALNPRFAAAPAETFAHGLMGTQARASEPVRH